LRRLAKDSPAPGEPRPRLAPALARHPLLRARRARLALLPVVVVVVVMVVAFELVERSEALRPTFAEVAVLLLLGEEVEVRHGTIRLHGGRKAESVKRTAWALAWAQGGWRASTLIWAAVCLSIRLSIFSRSTSFRSVPKGTSICEATCGVHPAT
jgi:hypothetical protein